ncbi:hypothetical protein Hrd1104_07050 [Halorhabdus sp. CBA1104]|uniref:hypothetical protein n=1 Tax=unclassified Halorhabdus TaxID=2621901 RepID=UPI0012B1ED05|nr:MULTISPECIES: hypothetical protein [unclassified Halorhabdus]QGN07077.1 hypothetical protein Hrd1104_07050 [Halorhabdus sp. CBA1104]
MSDSAANRCPSCGAGLDGSRICPGCGLEIRTDEGDLSSAATDAIVDSALSTAEESHTARGRTLPYPLRLATALAISVPFAPLSGFMLASVLPATPLGLVLVGMSAWMAPAGLLARTHVPSLIVGRGLTVLGGLVGVTPLLLALGRSVLGDAAVANPPISSSRAVVGSFLAFGLLILVFGLVVSRVAVRKRAAWHEDETGTLRSD